MTCYKYYYKEKYSLLYSRVAVTKGKSTCTGKVMHCKVTKYRTTCTKEVFMKKSGFEWLNMKMKTEGAKNKNKLQKNYMFMT